MVHSSETKRKLKERREHSGTKVEVGATEKVSQFFILLMEEEWTVFSGAWWDFKDGHLTGYAGPNVHGTGE